jgi:hypothetical protein
VGKPPPMSAFPTQAGSNVHRGPAAGARLLDLRRIVGPADYANPIEPNGPGGEKIAPSIRAMLA